jgi:protein-S-isoprenylcysteine O-methyltransferase Ste14
MSRVRWSWANVPLPEPHLAALAAAEFAGAIVPLRLPIGRRTAAILGWPTLATGAGIIAWGVTTASSTGIAIDRPSGLVTTGAFELCRNPMYQGWATAVVGLGLARRSPWILAAAAVAGAATHRGVLEEEASLSAAFGRDYDAYARSTPRYFGLAGALAALTRMIRGRPVDRDRRRR